MTKLDFVISTLDNLNLSPNKTGDNQFKSRCPNLSAHKHADKNPSLSISLGKNNGVLLNCHAGCNVNDICGAMGLSLKDLFEPSDSNNNNNGYTNETTVVSEKIAKALAKKDETLYTTVQRQNKYGKFVAEYNYIDIDGEVQYCVTRYIDKNGEKVIRPWTPVGDKWRIGVKYAKKIVLYNLHTVIYSRETDYIFICEGEKDCDRLADIGLVSTTNAFGATHWKQEFNEFFKDRMVVILQDNDKSGESRTELLISNLRHVAKEIRIICFTELGEKADVSDWIDKGHNASELLRRVENTKPWEHKLYFPPMASAPALPAYVRLGPDELAQAATAGTWIDEYSNFASKASPLTPREFHVGAALFAGGLAIARRLHLAVSHQSNWIRPNLYMLFVGASTKPRKTTALRVLRSLLKDADMEHFLLIERQTPEAFILDLSTRFPYTWAAMDYDEQNQWLKERAFAAQRGWLLEEAAQLLDSFGRDSTEGLLPLVLEMYDSSDNGPRRNTVSRGREVINFPYLNIFGATTYASLTEHIANRTHWQNGLFARFALIGAETNGSWTFWPDVVKTPPELLAKLKFIAHELFPTPVPYIVDEEEEEGKSNKTVQRVVLQPALESSPVVLDGSAFRWWEMYAKATSFDLLPDKPISELPEKFYSCYGRLGTMLAKVAMILATFDTEKLPVRIELRHMWRAQTIVESWRENLHKMVFETESLFANEAVSLIKAALGSSDNWVLRRDLLRIINKPWQQIETIVNDMIEDETIIAQSHKNERGRATEMYKLNN